MEKKKLKSLKSMYNNMETHLNSKSIKSKIQFEEKDDVKIPIEIQGTIKNTKFKIQISDEIRKDNSKPQVLLLINTEKDKYVMFKPLTNGQLVFILEQFVPKTIQIPQKK